MDSLVFIGIIATGAVVIAWYIRNEQAKSDGLLGLLALQDDPDSAKPNAWRRSYRIKTRIARCAHDAAGGFDARKAALGAERKFRTLDEGEHMRRRYRRQDEARYRVKDKAAKYKSSEERQPR